MVCFHKKYTLGDKHNLKPSDFSGWDELEKYLVEEKGATHILPIYMYDHSGIALRTTMFTCPWDSGQVGFIYASLEKSSVNDNEVSCQLVFEVEIYGKYINGEVLGYLVKNENDEIIDSCFGFFSEDETRAAAEIALLAY
jgi:hypothetical protein